jgi:hypothetical protein
MKQGNNMMVRIDFKDVDPNLVNHVVQAIVRELDQQAWRGAEATYTEATVQTKHEQGRVWTVTHEVWPTDRKRYSEMSMRELGDVVIS